LFRQLARDVHTTRESIILTVGLLLEELLKCN